MAAMVARPAVSASRTTQTERWGESYRAVGLQITKVWTFRSAGVRVSRYGGLSDQWVSAFRGRKCHCQHIMTRGKSVETGRAQTFLSILRIKSVRLATANRGDVAPRFSLLPGLRGQMREPTLLHYPPAKKLPFKIACCYQADASTRSDP